MNKLHFQNSGCICESARIYVFVCLSQNCTGSCHHRFTLQNVYTVSIIKTAFQETKLHLHNMKVKKAKLHQTSVLLLFSNSNCSTKIYLWAVLWNIFLFPYPLFFSNTSYIYIYIYIIVQLQMHTISPSLFQDNSHSLIALSLMSASVMDDLPHSTEFWGWKIDSGLRKRTPELNVDHPLHY